MKISSKRRRSKVQIQTDKDDAERLRLVTEEKLAQFEQMQMELQVLQQRAAGIHQVEGQVNHLLQSGLVKLQGDGSIEAVSGFEEQQYILQQRQQDDQRAQVLKQQEQLSPPLTIDPDRQRPDQQLEFDADILNSEVSGHIPSRRNSEINPPLESGAATPRTQGEGRAKITTRRNAGSKMQARKNQGSSLMDDHNN